MLYLNAEIFFPIGLTQGGFQPSGASKASKTPITHPVQSVLPDAEE